MSIQDPTPPPSRFHDGERWVQARVGLQDKMARVGAQAIRDHMPEQHREFFALLPFLLLGACDAWGQVWASILTNPPGFAVSPDPAHLHIDAQLAPWDALWNPQAVAVGGGLQAGQPVGLLGLQAHTRRRNRMNGVVTQADARGFQVAVAQSFGNCPKYTQAREAIHTPSTRHPVPVVVASPRLDDRTRRLVTRADTFFIASMHPAASGESGPAHGIDVSHRGGPPGFVRVDGDDMLTFPDYMGNFFFNTVGNLLLQPRAGLLFIDFETGAVAQIAIEAQVVWEGPALETWPGAQRLLRCHVRACHHTESALPLRWGPATLSPFLAPMVLDPR